MRHLSSIGLALVLLATLVACGTTQRPVTNLPSGERLYVLDTGPAGADARLMAIQPTTTQSITLPGGLVSQDHQRLYSAATSGATTKITILSTQTGAEQRSFTIAGAYDIPGTGFEDSVLSSDGRWLALRDRHSVANATAIALVDTQAGKIVKQATLKGSYTLDAISPNGGIIYVIEQLNDAERHYYVRAYQVSVGSLLEGYVADKTDFENPNMTGSPLTRQVSANGAQAYTLYINHAENKAFIHALPLVDTPNGPIFARCLDLPPGATPDLLRYYTLTLSPDGKTLYATNAALGIISVVSLSADDLFSMSVTGSYHFAPGALAPQASADREVRSAATISPDGKILYAVGAHGIAAITTATLALQRVYLPDRAFTSVAASADGATIYTADPTSGIGQMDLASGQLRATLPATASVATGHLMSIEWIHA